MAQLVVRDLDQDVKVRLQRQANRHGRSMEEEVLDILRDAVSADKRTAPGLGTRLRKRFAGIGLDTDIAELRGRPARRALWKR
ncbi:MAG: Arc family DNA-binding protein [Deltaproteobacteria bacterium]|nr:Arc family DNA-binding protein [Deltaproteobacteria bacterium]